MRLNMHLFFSSLVILVFLFPHETFSDTTDSGGCQRQCGDATVPYPFGFSSGCPIGLYCDGGVYVSLLPDTGGINTSYHIISFNSTISTLLIALPMSCSRSVTDTRTSLSGANYGVSSRTGMFLHGGCGSNVSVCSVSAGIMSNLLRTAQCDVNGTGSAAGPVACVASSSANATSPGTFLRWEKAESTKCDDVLTSALFADTPEGAASLEFGLAELGWWLNGTCTGGREPCATNATCSDVQTPTGSVGHQCSCAAGMDGDGFLAGDGCYVLGEGCFHFLTSHYFRFPQLA